MRLARARTLRAGLMFVPETVARWRDQFLDESSEARGRRRQLQPMPQVIEGYSAD